MDQVTETKETRSLSQDDLEELKEVHQAHEEAKNQIAQIEQLMEQAKSQLLQAVGAYNHVVTRVQKKYNVDFDKGDQISLETGEITNSK